MSQQNILEKEQKQEKKFAKKMKREEQNAINEKALFIMKHSKSLLEKIKNEDDNFKKSLIAYLIADLDHSFDSMYEENLYDYCDSQDVIFQLCFALPNLDFTSEECKKIRDKLRLYTKRFEAKYDYEYKSNCKYIVVDETGFVNATSHQKTI